MVHTRLKKPERILFISFLIVLSVFIIPLLSADNSGGKAESQKVKPLEFNREQLVQLAVQGYISPPGFGDPPYRIDPDGKIHVLPGIGSITYNVRTGDSAVLIAGDHVEPAVSLHNNNSTSESRGLNTLSCIGNRVKVLTGEAKGAEGWVTGKHGGAEHVMVDFPDDSVFDKLAIGDKMRVYAFGVGLKFTNVQGVSAMNVSPHLIDVLTKSGMGITEEEKLRIAVTHRIPAKIMGSGLGRSHVYRGDYDIQLFDKETVKEFGLESLCFGDIVAILDADHTYGRIYRKGAVSIGVISHGRSTVAGHGPGVTTLLTSADGQIETVLNPKANLANLLGIR